MYVCVCLCWEGLKIINTERSQGQIVINTVKLRANRRMNVCVCVCEERERWQKVYWEWLGKMGGRVNRDGGGGGRKGRRWRAEVRV